jgi:NADPH:quinone reductase-like Zn-dependent oxidoreductase
MPLETEAWFLYPRKPGEPRSARLVRESFELADPADDEVRVEPIYGSWEGNMSHAVDRKPIDICRQRGEDRVVIGNSGVVRITALGRSVRHLREGQYAIVSNVAVPDAWGYAEKIYAYDAPGTMGLLSRALNTKAASILPLPEPTRHTLEQWAVFSLRYITAWSNWEAAHGMFRLLVGADELPAPNVWGWGGGTTLAELALAARSGCRVVMLSGNAQHRETIRRHGVEPLDRHQFGALQFDDKRWADDREYRDTYVQAEARFLDEVKRRTDGLMVQIFIDYIGGPVYRATLKALGRESVITTAGWMEGMVVSHLRAVECIDRHQHVYTHYARRRQCEAAIAYGEAHGWMPIPAERTYTFDEIPALADDFRAGKTDIFPVYAINEPPP